MTDVEWIPETGDLALGPAVLDALADADQGEGPPPAYLDRLKRAGLVNGAGRVMPPLDAVIAATRETLVRLALALISGGDRRQGRGWVGADDAVLALSANGAADPVALVPPAGLPALIARIVALGPRPYDALPGVVTARDAALDAVVGAGLAEDAVRERLELDPAPPDPWLTALTAPESLRWTVEAIWAPDPSAWQARLDVVDTPEHGLMLVERIREDDGLVVLIPATSTLIWERLTMLVPPAGEHG